MRVRYTSLLGVALCCSSVMAHAATGEKDLALAVYAGSLTDNNWRQSLSGQADFVDAHLLAVALGRTLWRSEGRALSLEAEANLARHWGMQDHWEVNAMVTARWHRFPWSDALATSVAFGAGPSYASKVPAAEVANDGSSEKGLLYWHLELTLGPPKADWTALFRLHHRSTGYGAFGEAGGGNALTAGVRWFF